MAGNGSDIASLGDIKRLAQDNPDIARNLVVALAQVAPAQVAAAAAEAAPERAAAAAAEVAPDQAAVAAARVAPQQAAAAAAEAAPEQAAAALAEAAPLQAAVGSPGAQRNLALLRLEKYAGDDVEKAVVAQLNLLDAYYNTALGQARQSFKWALIAAAVGLGFFLFAVTVLLVQSLLGIGQQLDTIAIVSVVSGAIVEVVSGVNFYLFNKTNNQVSNFHGTLIETQRFLLANSICEALGEAEKNKTRSGLVGAMTNFQASGSKGG